MHKPNNEVSAGIDAAAAGIARNVCEREASHASGRYHVECRDSGGKLIWSDDIENIVTTVGGNDALDKYLAGSAYTAAWYLGLISSASYVSVPVLADTAASHATWTEDQNYSQSTRPAAAWSSASGKSKAFSSPLTFTMNAGTTLKGCFLISNSTKGGTTGILFSAGLFSGGDQPVVAGNTVTVSYTASI